MAVDMASKATEWPLVSLTVRLTPIELAALSHVAVVVTSAADVKVINAAETGLRRIREAAARQAGKGP